MSNSDIFGLVGTGGFGREVMPYLKAARQRAEFAGSLAFVDIEQKTSTLNELPVMLEADFLSHSAGKRYFNIALDNGHKRREISDAFIAKGCVPRSIFAPNAVVLDGVEIGEGAIFCAFSMATSNARIGRFFHANIYAYVAHDCTIGDFVTFAPGVKCNGNVVVEDHAYVGTGAVIKQGRPGKPLVIGRGAIVGMGAVVTKDVMAGTTVVGNPARPLS
ncbi:acetyltransferase [Bradyrhizobium manausense]|uniref:acetyltransferase n=1 Tax=Bradyrhizobium manausense TaxID=989370 RepID=UPI001BA83D01|nr:acetyltransferase [Bradyrhizobium manausense]MBR0826177.1 acetyltransferase [Bradyrhizobium manausense]